MDFDAILAGLCAAGLFVYLVYSLFRPEQF
ncbi:MAG: K(+)-transporting ATPase subunit F [Anaerolineae bacterium]|nr:K(+)-transporting ATPase subunit F [Promineifilum sp.]MCZ2112768.1 K(+)-transporting ATPase subunit F [Anaerolineae bacterium]